MLRSVPVLLLIGLLVAMGWSAHARHPVRGLLEEPGFQLTAIMDVPVVLHVSPEAADLEDDLSTVQGLPEQQLGWTVPKADNDFGGPQEGLIAGSVQGPLATKQAQQKPLDTQVTVNRALMQTDGTSDDPTDPSDPSDSSDPEVPDETDEPSPTDLPEPEEGPGGGTCNDAQTVLDQTNEYRALHGSKALHWSTSLAESAQAWADSLVEQYGCSTWGHSPAAMRGVVGENLYKITIGGSFDYMGRLESYGCSMAVNAWYGENRLYKWDKKKPWTANSRNFNSIGHFTALVWASTSMVGCGQATASYPNGRALGCKIIACQYKTAGNVATNNYFKKNVKPPIATTAKK